ncbi:MAG TPA: hypothetical protein VGL09_10850 [Methylomirabilota bacterium]|jgi:hypothetical protein
MKRRDVAVALPLLVITTACATTTTTALPRGFEDVPAPRGLAYQPGRSMSIESPSAKAVHLVYRGRTEPDVTAMALRATLEATGWRHISSSTRKAGPQGTVQVFEKEGSALQLDISRSLWFTYVTYDVSRPTAMPSATASRAGEPTPARADVAGPGSGAGAESAGAGADERATTSASGPWARLKEQTLSLGESVKTFISEILPR